ncbi:unnamed protein product [Arctogadus glacialis]
MFQVEGEPWYFCLGLGNGGGGGDGLVRGQSSPLTEGLLCVHPHPHPALPVSHRTSYGGPRLLTLTLRVRTALTKAGLVVAAGGLTLTGPPRVKRLPCCLGRPGGYQGPHQRRTKPSLGDQSGQGSPSAVSVSVRVHCSPPGQMLPPQRSTSCQGSSSYLHSETWNLARRSVPFWVITSRLVPAVVRCHGWNGDVTPAVEAKVQAGSTPSVGLHMNRSIQMKSLRMQLADSGEND